MNEQIYKYAVYVKGTPKILSRATEVGQGCQKF